MERVGVMELDQLQRDAAAFFYGSLICEMRGGNIFDRQAKRFEDGDLGVRFAGGGGFA